MSSQPQPLFNLNFDTNAATDKPAPEKVKKDTAPKFNLNFDTGKAAPTSTQPRFNLNFGSADQQPAPAVPDSGSWLTRSVIQDVAGSDVLESGRQKISSAVGKILPASMQGSFLSDFADEASKAGPGFVNFMTSPTGLALIGAHMVPALAPYAAVGDLILGGQQALQAIPDVASAIGDYKNGRKWGRAMVDLLGAYAGLKGGARVGEALRTMPTDIKAGTPMLQAYSDAFRRTAPPPPSVSTRAADLKARLDAAAPEDRADIIQEAAQPQNLREKFEKGLYSHPLTRNVANVLLPGVRQPPILELGQHFVDEYIKNIEVERNRVRRDMTWIKQNVPLADQNIRRMGFAMEGDQPEGGPLSAKGEQGNEMIRELNRRRDQMLIDSGQKESILRDPETYIRHYWDFTEPNPADPNSPQKLRIANRMMKDPSLQARKIGSLKLGMTPENEGGYGLRPQYENVTDIVTRRHMEAVRAIENQKFANTLRDYGLIVDPTKANVRALTSWPAATDAPAIKRAVYSGEGKSGEAILREKAPLVHPDIQMAVNAIYGEPFKGVGWNAINQLFAFSKQIQVGFSLFHLNMVSEIAQAHAIGAGGWKAIPRAIKAAAWPLDPEFIKGVRNSVVEVRGRVAEGAPPDVSWNKDLVNQWIKAGGRFQSSESEAAAIQFAMNLEKSLANRGPLLKAAGVAAGVVGKTQYVFNRALFDYYLPGQWLHAAEHLYASESNRLGPNPTPEAVFQKRQAIAEHLNRTIGTENFQHLMLSPKMQQAMRVAFFAPTWMLSRLRTLTKGYETTTNTRLSNNYLAGAALAMMTTTQLANYALSAWYGDPKRYPNGGGEYWDEASQQVKRGGHLTWQNYGDPVYARGKAIPGVGSHLGDVYFGQNPDGSQRYIRQGKYATDAFLMFLDPDKVFGKMSAPLQALFTIATKHEPGSGFEAIEKDLEPGQQWQQRLSVAARPFIPFSAETGVQWLEHKASPEVFREPGSTSQFLGLSARRGASFDNSVQALKQARDLGRPDLEDQVIRNAAANGYSLKSLEYELKKEDRKGIRRAEGIPATEPPPAPVGR